MIKNKYAYIHIQKSGGTSFSRAIEGVECIDNLGHTYSYEIKMPRSWDHAWGKFKVYNKSDYEQIFTLVRNPFNVLISYYENMDGGKKHGWGRVNSEYNYKTWEEFLNGYIKSNEDWHFPNMNKSMFAFIYDEHMNPNIDFYFKLEEPQNIRNFLKQYTTNRFGHLNRSLNREVRKYYTDINVEKLNEIWKNDLEYFNYKYEGQ